MIRQTETELKTRLTSKELEQALLTQLQQGFDRSPFESRAILQVVKETFLGQLSNPSHLKPGQMVTTAIKADQPPGKALPECQFVPIVVTVHSPEDEHLRQRAGRQAVARVRRVQIERMAWEAVAQDTYLTVEDLAYRILNCGVRTIEKDLAHLRDQAKEIPLRGQQLDIGRVISHKVLAVRLFLERKTYTQIQRQINHSHHSIQRYIEGFVAVTVMTTAGHTVFEISFLRQMSPALVREYQKLYDFYNTPDYRQRLAEIMAQFRPTALVSAGEKGGSIQ